MIHIKVIVLLIIALTHAISQSTNRTQWTMEIMTSNAPIIGRIFVYTTSDRTIWLQGQIDNDIWSSSDLGTNWELRSGISRRAEGVTRSVFSNASYSQLNDVAGCVDVRSGIHVRIGGRESTSYPFTNQVWTSTNHTHWQFQSSSALPPQAFATCVFTSNGDLVTIGTNNSDSDGMYNYVWRGKRLGSQFEWNLVSVAPWEPKRLVNEVIVAQMPIGEVLYVIGGVSDNGQGFTNDVWASSDQGVSWVPFILDGGGNPHTNTVTSVRSFPPRGWHTTKVTDQGAILVMGGISSTSDVWISFDGGFNFFECSVQPHVPPFFGNDQGIIFTPEGELVAIAGWYVHPGGTGGRPNLLVSKSNFSVNNSPLLAELCGAQIPDKGVGLRSWPIPSSNSISGSSDVHVQWFVKFVAIGMFFHLLSY